MKNYLTICLIAVLALTNWHCGGGTSSASGSGSTDGAFSGSIANAANLKVFIDHISPTGANQVIGSTDIDASGNFSVPFPKVERGMYRMRIGKKNVTLSLSGTEKGVNVKGDLETMDKYQVEVSGSDDAKAYVNTMSDFIGKKINKDGVKNFAESTPNLISAMYLASSILRDDEKYLGTHKKILGKMAQDNSYAGYAGEYTKFVSQVEQRIQKNKLAQLVSIGQPAPDIKLPSPKGKEYALSDLKGKVVLLDFWASWCGPCRKANPHVVDTYNKYKGQGFTVFSVSLDGLDTRTKSRLKDAAQIDKMMTSSKDRWVKAIQQDNLMWDYHVSDLKKWESAPARMYGVTSIPRTFLIDRDGKIAAINPRNNLESEVKKLL